MSSKPDSVSIKFGVSELPQQRVFAGLSPQHDRLASPQDADPPTFSGRSLQRPSRRAKPARPMAKCRRYSPSLTFEAAATRVEH